MYVRLANSTFFTRFTPSPAALLTFSFALVASPVTAEERPANKPWLPTAVGVPQASISPVPRNANNHQELAYVVLPEQLEGRAYYRLDAKATCKANTEEQTEIKSWANKISFHHGKLLLWGLICNDTAVPIALQDAAKTLLISHDLTKLRYQGEEFTYAEQPPKLCEQGLWCPSAEEQ